MIKDKTEIREKDWHYSYCEKVIEKWPLWKKRILELDIKAHEKNV